MKECLVLFSGGIDSTTALYWAVSQYKKVYALTFDYGQRHSIEIAFGQRITTRLQIPHKILLLNLWQIGGSSLTDFTLDIPEFDKVEEIDGGLPLTYVPFRNGIFLSMAAAWAEVKGIRDIICGFNIIDSPNYPDTSSSFVEAMEKAINLGTKALFSRNKTRVVAPFIHMKKSEIIRVGFSLGTDYSYAISCYAGREVPCGKCSSCLLRRKAFLEAEKKDPLIERLEKEGRI